MLAQLHSITKKYDQGKPVLDSIDLLITENDTIAITGPSGSGKSTLLNILGTLDQPSSGQVLLDGKDVKTLDRKQLAELRNHFTGFVFQQHHLLPQLTLLENVLLPTLPGRKNGKEKPMLERASLLMERVGLQDLMHKFPGQTSVGECQRTAVVRALINRPALLLADEPTGSLDNDNAEKLGVLLRELNKEQHVALVVVTHSMEMAAGMEKIYKLHSGKLERIK